jgi:hypothetical protein
VFDIKARWQVLDQLALNLGVNNLFDERYGTQRRNGRRRAFSRARLGCCSAATRPSARDVPSSNRLSSWLLDPQRAQRYWD